MKTQELDDLITGAALEPSKICRDDRCQRLGIHLHHKVTGPAPVDVLVPISNRRMLLREIVLRHVSRRCCRLFNEIYTSVVNDYGTVNQRRVYRALVDLERTRQIANVSVGRCGSAQRAKPGGYVRYDSPTLWEPDGYAFLVSTIEDALPEGQRARIAPRRIAPRRKRVPRALLGR